MRPLIQLYKFRITLFTVSFICISSLLNTISAQQFNNWHFLEKNALAFDKFIPSVITTSQVTGSNGSSSSISDRFGNLLFYTSGVKVWNRNNQVMPNGTGLPAYLCQLNGVMIIPFVNDTNKYYIFTSDGLSFNTSRPDTLKYSYSVVDMRADNGLGDVVQKNVFIRGYANEKMVAIPHANGVETWWVCRDWDSSFYAYKIGCNGLDAVPVVSLVGAPIKFDQTKFQGDIKASPDGKFIACCYKKYFELYRFDNATGQLSNCIQIPADDNISNLYGVEFSPNSKVLYFSELFYPYPNLSVQNTYITQFDLAVYDSTFIKNSRIILNSNYQPSGNGVAGSLQLGPDNKIYYAPIGNRLSRIEFPDLLGTGCTFSNGLIVMPNFMVRRLPYSYVNLITNQTVRLSYSVASDCRTVTFTGKTYIKGNHLTFNWNFGDGVSQSQTVPSGGDTTYATITHLYPPGIDTFFATLTLTSDTVCGQGSAGTKVVVKPPRPTARFGYQAACNNLTVSFSDSSLLNFNPSLSYQWQFLDKANTVLGTSTLQNPSFTYPRFDTVRARLIVSSALACVAGDTALQTLVLSAKPTASFSVQESCGSLQAFFTNTSAVAGDTIKAWYWNFGDGTTSNLKNPVHAFAAYSTYTVQLVTQSSGGCTSDTTSQPLMLRAKPVAAFSYHNNACEGKPFSLADSSTVSGTSLAAYYWSIPAAQQSFATQNIQPALAAGSYVVQHAVASAQGCPSDTLSRTIVVESIPLVSLSAASGCTGTALAFTSSVAMPVGTIASWQWSVSNGLASAQPSPSFTFTTPGSYTITHTVTSSNGCTAATAQAPVAIDAVPQPSFSFTAPCVGTVVSFTNTTPAPASLRFVWKVDSTVAGTQPALFYTFATDGTYTIALQATSPNGCTAAVSRPLVAEAFFLRLTASPNPAFSGDAVELSTTAAAGYSVLLWKPVRLFSAQTLKVQRLVADSSQLVEVVGQSGGGCRDTASLVLEVKVLDDVYVPSAFTPNGDGRNDVLRVVGGGIASLDFRIFNRWGQLVFYSKDKAKGWDGRMNSTVQPAGTYVYLAKITKQNGQVVEKKGTVTLIK